MQTFLSVLGFLPDTSAEFKEGNSPIIGLSFPQRRGLVYSLVAELQTGSTKPPNQDLSACI